MVLNKKANIFQLWFYVVIFNVFIAIAFTLLLGFNNMADSEILTPIHSEVSAIAQERTSEQIQDYIDNALVEYRNNTLPWDIIIFGLMINFYFFIIYSAIKTRKENPLIVFSMLTFGSIILLLLIGISIDIQEWIIQEIYIDVFEDLSVSTPIMDWMFENIGIVSFIMGLVVLIINQFDKLKKILLGGQEQ